MMVTINWHQVYLNTSNHIFIDKNSYSVTEISHNG